jgi:hypothetical protein
VALGDGSLTQLDPDPRLHPYPALMPFHTHPHPSHRGAPHGASGAAGALGRWETVASRNSIPTPASTPTPLSCPPTPTRTPPIEVHRMVQAVRQVRWGVG